MSTAKVAITVPKEVLDRARLAVKRGKAASLSAYVTRALEQMANDDDFDALLDKKLRRSGGPVTEEEALARPGGGSLGDLTAARLDRWPPPAIGTTQQEPWPPRLPR